MRRVGFALMLVGSWGCVLLLLASGIVGAVFYDIENVFAVWDFERPFRWLINLGLTVMDRWRWLLGCLGLAALAGLGAWLQWPVEAGRPQAGSDPK